MGKQKLTGRDEKSEAEKISRRFARTRERFSR